MRFRITLHRNSKSNYLPINYQYELSSAIYKTIDIADNDFSKFLHGEGYLAFGKKFRLFTFSRLKLDRYKVITSAGRIEHNGNEASFEISFLMDKVAEEFIKGLFTNQVFTIGDKISNVRYSVAGIIACNPPVFNETMSYLCLSPIFIRKKRDDGGESYLHPSDKEYSILLVQNLLSKSKAFAIASNISDEFDNPPIPNFAFEHVGKVYKNGVKIKQLTKQETHLVGYIYEFSLTAPIELHEAGYYAGFGHLGSQGFGCVGVKGG